MNELPSQLPGKRPHAEKLFEYDYERQIDTYEQL